MGIQHYKGVKTRRLLNRKGRSGGLVLLGGPAEKVS